MSKLQVDTVVNLEDTGAPSLSYGAEVPVGYGITGAGGINVSGAATVAAGTFSGAVNIDATTDSTSSTSGALIVDGGLGVAKNVYIGAGLSVAGTLTYEDVTNVDSVGLITAKSGVNVSGGQVTIGTGITMGIAGVTTFSGTSDVHLLDSVQLNVGDGPDLKIYHTGSQSRIENSGTGELRIQADTIQITDKEGNDFHIECNHDGNVELYYDNSKKFETTNDGTVTTGISTVTVGTDLNGYKVEEGSYDTDALNGEFDFLLEDGHVQTHTGSTAGTYFPDFKVSSGVSLSQVMDVGDVVSCTLIVTASNTAHYCTTGIKIDNSSSNVTIEWIGSTAPSAGKGAGYDVYGFTIQKTAATPAYLVIVNATDAG